MWKQQAPQEFAQYADSADKCFMDTVGGDSGFLSNSSSASYIYSSEYSPNSIAEDTRVASAELITDMDSGIDFGLSDSFNQLSLKQMTLDPLGSGEMHLEPMSKSTPISIDSGRVSMTTSVTKDNEIREKPWQLYFTQNDDGDTLLHIAIIEGLVEATLSLINIVPHPCLFDMLNDHSQTALHLAVITKQPKIVRRLVLAGADLSIRNYQGNTALHLACMTGDLECAKALTEPITTIERNLSIARVSTLSMNLEQRNYNGETCLHVATTRGHVELVRHLLRLGADLEAREGLGGRTPLHLAIECAQAEVLAYLLRECSPEFDAASYAGLTARLSM